jgi:hypothetical protein
MARCPNSALASHDRQDGVRDDVPEKGIVLGPSQHRSSAAARCWGFLAARGRRLQKKLRPREGSRPGRPMQGEASVRNVGRPYCSKEARWEHDRSAEPRRPALRDRWRARGTLCLVVSASMAGARPARALQAAPPAGFPPTSGPSCADPRVRVDGAPGDGWIEAIVRACEALAAMSDSDHSARIILVPSGQDLIVEVSLADGRSTFRRVTAPSSLNSILAALVELPVEQYFEPAGIPVDGTPPPAALRQLPTTPAPAATSPPSPRVGVELGAAASGRVAGQGYLSFGPSAFAQLVVGAWALGIDARWEALEAKSGADSTFEMETVAVGLTLTHEFRAHALDIDVGLSPRLVDETQSDDAYANGNAFSTTDVRMAALVRATLGWTHVRPLVTLDGELSPTRVRRLPRLNRDLPPLPAWSAGLSLGVQWSEL